NGRGIWSVGTVDSVFGVRTGFWSSLDIGVGGAKVSYQDNNNGRLHMAVCTGNCNNGAASTWNRLTVDNGPGTGLYTTLRQDENGQAHISYWDQSQARVRYAVQVGNTNTFTIVNVDTALPGMPSMMLGPPGTNFAYSTGTALRYFPSSLF
ncbi:MAG TPA: hypothetical protein VK447_01915, partial [Myxococcaceae bacterium]|nr:hypothetical protein [Myxococcaceae bacterium]